MHELAVQIVRFVDADQPGFVESVFVDAAGRRHTIVNKLPMFTADDLNAGSSYPTCGTVSCEILDRHRDQTGRKLVRISTAKPYYIEATEGLSEFTVDADLMASTPVSSVPSSTARFRTASTRNNRARLHALRVLTLLILLTMTRLPSSI
jgi:hypothetical protein